ncbi:MAG: hypothetical protein IJ545_00830 [Alphaproteobacteria bacterium]|nr:hypothetical protein [Alphaproteobacteria bacterium]
MKKAKKCFEFFTMGGSQRWEDVFFYQKWRIQRNYKTKQYRLLDNWDIRRAEGSFDDCYKHFLTAIEIHQLSRQHGHMVIMLHGLADSKNIFKPLWREVIKYGFMVAAINYPSTYKRIDSHVRQLDFFLNHLEDVREISFITSGCGALILRKLLYFDADWKKKIKLRKIIEINPPSKGSKFWAKVSRSKWLKKLFGPILADITPTGVQRIPEYDKKYKVGIICCHSLIAQFCKILPDHFKNYTPFFEEYIHGDIKEATKINAKTLTVMKCPDLASKCVKFLKEGEF